MKKLAICAIVLNLLFSVMYTIKVHLLIETDAEFIRASLTNIISMVGLYCLYYYARDYEACKAHEEHAKRVASHFVMMTSSIKDEEPQEKQ